MNKLSPGKFHNLSSTTEFPVLPERTLLVAILERATLDACGLATADSADAKARIEAEARAWMASESDAPWSFSWVCDLLGISSSALRRVLLDRRLPSTVDHRRRDNA